MSDQVPDLPEPYASLVDAVCQRDAEFFAAYPDSRGSVRRPYMPGGFYPMTFDSEPIATMVTQIAPGLRMRQPMFEAQP
jgi:hypothetical protein